MKTYKHKIFRGQKSILLLTFISVLFSYQAFPQTAILWGKSIGGTYADFGKWISSAPLGDYYLGGYTNSNDGDIPGNIGGMDVFVMRLDSNGTIKWKKNYGGTGNDYIHGLLSTKDGGAIIRGYTMSSDLPGYDAAYDIWLVKIDENGIVQWQKTYGGTQDDGLHGVDVQEHPNGGYIMTASTTSADGDVSVNKGAGDSWLVRLSVTGNIIWEKCFGGSDDEDTHSVTITADTGYLVAGHTTSEDGNVSGLHSTGYDDAWLYKTDSSGNFQWQTCLGGTSTELFKCGCKVNGGYVFAGYTDSNDGDVSGNHGIEDGWVVKVNSSGTILWSKSIGGTQGDYFNNIAQGYNGTIVLSGLTNSNDGDVHGNHGDFDYWVVVLDSVGNFLWQRCLGGSGSDRGEFAFPAPGPSWVVTGFSNSTSGEVTGNQGLYDAWTLRLYDCSWLDASFNHSPLSVCANDVVNVTNTSVLSDSSAWYINGVYYSSLNEPAFSFPVPRKDTIMLVSFSGVCSDTSIQVIDTKPLPYVYLGADTSICPSCNIVLDAGNPGSSYLWSTGETAQTVTFSQQPDTVSVIVTFNGCVSYDTIYVDLNTGINNEENLPLKIYPNPVKDVICVSLTGMYEGEYVSYRLLAVNGYEIVSGDFIGRAIIDLKEFASGVYLIEIIYKGHMCNKKFIKM